MAGILDRTVSHPALLAYHYTSKTWVHMRKELSSEGNMHERCRTSVPFGPLDALSESCRQLPHTPFEEITPQVPRIGATLVSPGIPPPPRSDSAETSPCDDPPGSSATPLPAIPTPPALRNRASSGSEYWAIRTTSRNSPSRWHAHAPANRARTAATCPAAWTGWRGWRCWKAEGRPG